MRKISFVLLLLLALPVLAQDGTPGDPGLGDSYYPEFGNGGYDVTHYTLDLTADVESNTIQSVVTIDATATQDLSSFNLDLVGLEVESITVNDQDADYKRSGQELTITPAEALPEGEPFTVEIAYGGEPESMTSVALPVLTGWIWYGDGIMVISEPDGTASFVPVNDHPLDKATWTLRVTVPEPYEVAMNGVVTEIVDNGSTTTTISEVTSPMASYLLTINIGDFDLVEEAGTNGVPIRNYFDATLPDDYREPFELQDEMIGCYEGLFGEYPFDVYGAVVINTETGTALENQTLSLFGADMLDPSYGDYAEMVIAHELLHQWFGDSVAVADWSDIWLNEGWATYGEGLWIECSRGRNALEDWAAENYDYADYAEMSPPGNVPADDLFNESVYVRGGLTLHALRLTIGDDDFFALAREWYARFRDSNASTADFIALAEEISGQDLADFFDAWLYDEPLPELP